ncbi:MAG: glutamine-hydrolyzing GMP synthase [Desulfohalobiaceae bacterium]|nr:glutamine-hydrolyzing GMP synthase [Desulfohalobiaceae bacterium]MCF8085372.1 glutamine-hydrolyzing GMP synthase [Desulfohalobiaceae bacterium]
MTQKQQKVVILDFGSQYTQLIARRVREAGVYSEIHPCGISPDRLEELEPSALILSGGPASVSDPESPGLESSVLSLGCPVLGICYGMQLLARICGGRVQPSENREYGRADLEVLQDSPLFKGVAGPGDVLKVWMSHGDTVLEAPEGFAVPARTDQVDVAAMAHPGRGVHCLQFHPEVSHTEGGDRILRNFLFEVARLQPTWSMASFIDTQIREVRERVGSSKVVCGLSGGIDSTVVAVLLHEALGEQLHCIFVDNGLLRADEGEEVVQYLRRHFDLNLSYVQAQDEFLSRLEGVSDPEEKRRIVGNTFIEIFEREARSISGVRYLAQGTLYPDVIESVSSKGPSAVIKSHHNVGGLPERMDLELIEPLRELFKDEVRKVALELGLPDFLVWRHPFPGPGLAIRMIGQLDSQGLEILRQADRIVHNELMASGWYFKIWQGFAVLLPMKTVGVMGDERTYEHVVALRVVESTDAMTADWAKLPDELLSKISNRIINEVRGVNRVVLDISSKPPSTIEWE